MLQMLCVCPPNWPFNTFWATGGNAQNKFVKKLSDKLKFNQWVLFYWMAWCLQLNRDIPWGTKESGGWVKNIDMFEKRR